MGLGICVDSTCCEGEAAPFPSLACQGANAWLPGVTFAYKIVRTRSLLSSSRPRQLAEPRRPPPHHHHTSRMASQMQRDNTTSALVKLRESNAAPPPPPVAGSAALSAPASLAAPPSGQTTAAAPPPQPQSAFVWSQATDKIVAFFASQVDIANVDLAHIAAEIREKDGGKSSVSLTSHLT